MSNWADGLEHATVPSELGFFGLKHREVAVYFEAGYLAAVVGPFFALVAEEEVEDVLA